MPRPSFARLIGAVAVLASISCSLGEKAIAPTAAQVVVHAVLDPGAPIQEVLVEQTLTGTVQVNQRLKYDPLDPINTGDGVPISGALVTIAGPDGILTALEHKYTGKAPGYGAGRYEIQTGAGLARILPGAQYVLTVRTLAGAVVTGTTVVPNSALFVPGTRIDSFDRDRDTLRLGWKAVAGARTYALRVESPFGPFLLFSDTTHVELAGDFRNLFASDLQRLFIPGFQQVVTLVAVDSNYFDYYRSANDPFTGSGIISRLQGGIGLFGSVILIDSRTIDVTQQPVEPALEGDYELAQGPPMTKPFVDVMRLYVETPGTASASLSGWYSRDRKLTARDGIAGARDGTRIELTFLLNQDSRQHLATFVGTQLGDSLVGAYTGVGGRVVLRKRVAP